MFGIYHQNAGIYEKKTGQRGLVCGIYWLNGGQRGFLAVFVGCELVLEVCCLVFVVCW